MKKKAKILSVMTLPLILGACSAVRPTTLAQINKPILRAGTGIGYANDTGGGGGSSYNYQTTGYPSLYGYETHTHSVVQTILGSAPTISDDHIYHDSGIKFYGSGTSTTVGSANSITLNQTGPYIDFTDANVSYPYQVTSSWEKLQASGSISPNGQFPLISHYRLEVNYSSGTRAYYVDMSIADPMNDAQTVTTNKNGSSTTVKQTEYGINPKNLGRIAVPLYNGSYSAKLTVEYFWIYINGSNITQGGSIVKGTASLSGSLLIDSIKPTLSARTTSSNATVSNGSYVKENVRVTASDTNFSYIYYKTPTSSGGITYSSSFTTSSNGKYEFYALDRAGNQSATLSFYVDTVAPVGKLYANGSEIASGKYVNSSFSYVATDSGSGLKGCFYKAPNSSSFVAYSSGSIVPSNSGDGWYEFYSVDNAGNESAHMKVYLETARPEVSILRNSAVVYKGAITKNERINTGLYFNEGDYIEFDYSSSSGVYTNGTFRAGTRYLLRKSAYPNSTYSNTITTATGTTVTYDFSIVRDLPSITIGGKRYDDGAVIRLATDETVSMNVDDVIDSGNCVGEINDRDTVKIFDLLTENTADLTANEGQEKSYVIKVSDPAGNVSRFTVIIDKDAANGQWMNDNQMIEDGSYVNHPVSFDFNETEATATISKDGSAFRDYSSGEVISEDGSYTIILKDDVGNSSEFRIVIDTKTPEGTIYVDGVPADNDIITNGKLYFTWDGDDTCTVNGESYAKNSLIDQEGVYEFVLSDKAGNKSFYEAEIDRTAPSANKDALSDSEKDSTPITKWFQVSFDDKKKDFANYDDALSYAIELEKSANVKAHQLTDVTEFTETGMVANNGDPSSDKDDVRTGTYWSYKSKSNANVTLYYFDEDLLNEVIEYYAKQHVSDAIYSDGVNSPDGVNDDTWSYEGIEGKIGNNLILINDGDAVKAVARKGEQEIALEYGKALGSQISESGIWTIVETDRAGNECSYEVIIDHETPALMATLETYSSGSTGVTISEKSLVNAGVYYLKSFSVSQILSGDKWAEVEISGNGSTARYVSFDEMPTLAKAGKYDIRVWDRLGHSISFIVYISGEEENVVFENNADDTSVNISIEMPENYEALTSIEIYRNGSKLDGVSTDKLNYTFDKDGVYKVVLKDNFGRAVTKEYTFTKALPQGVLSGVDANGKTKNDVTFTYDSEKYFCEVYMDSELVRIDSSGSVLLPAEEENSGHYEIKLVNATDLDNFRVYAFEIDRLSPSVQLGGVIDHGTTNGGVTASWDDLDVVSATYTFNGSEPISFENGHTFEKEGTYVLTVADDLGNTTTKTFTIDKTVDYSVYTDDGKKIGGDATTSNDVIISANEDAVIKVIKDGEAYDYSFGQALSEEGTYLITVQDAYGNKTSFTIVIDKTVAFDMNVADGGITNDPVTIAPGEKETIVVTRNGEAYDYKAGEAITEEGTYRAIITDAYGNTKEVNFQIVSSDARTSIDYQLGDGCEITGISKDGESIECSGNHVLLTEDGTYVISYTKDGNSYSFTLRLDTTAPEISLNGVSDGGTVDGVVTIDGLTEEGTVEVYKDGQKIAYSLGDEIKDYGHYEVVVTDALGNSRTYAFTLQFQMNAWAITLIAVGLAAAIGVTATIVLKRKRVFKKRD